MASKKSSITALMTASTSSLAPAVDKAVLRPAKSQQKLKNLKDKRRHSALGILGLLKTKSFRDSSSQSQSPEMPSKNQTDSVDSPLQIDSVTESFSDVKSNAAKIPLVPTVLCLSNPVEFVGQMDYEECGPFYDDMVDNRSQEKDGYVFTRQRTVRFKKQRPRSFGDTLGITYEEADEQVDLEAIKEKLRQASQGLSDGDVCSQVFVPVTGSGTRDPVAEKLPNVPSRLLPTIAMNDLTTEENQRTSDTKVDKEILPGDPEDMHTFTTGAQDIVLNDPRNPTADTDSQPTFADGSFEKQQDCSIENSPRVQLDAQRSRDSGFLEDSLVHSESFLNALKRKNSTENLETETVYEESNLSLGNGHNAEDEPGAQALPEENESERNSGNVFESNGLTRSSSGTPTDSAENVEEPNEVSPQTTFKETETEESEETVSEDIKPTSNKKSEQTKSESEAECLEEQIESICDGKNELNMESSASVSQELSEVTPNYVNISESEVSESVIGNEDIENESGFVDVGHVASGADEINKDLLLEAKNGDAIERSAEQFCNKSHHQPIEGHNICNSNSCEKNQSEAEQLLKLPEEEAAHILRDDECRSPHCSTEKHCTACKCARDSHDVIHQDPVNVKDRVGLKESSQGQAIMTMSSKLKGSSSDIYTWIPAGIGPDKVEEYMRTLPRDKVPKRGSVGERWRERQLASQLPRQDLALAYCRHVEPQNHESYQDFVDARNDIALDIAYVKETVSRPTNCYRCGSPVPLGSVAVMSPKFGETVAWHPGCFQCSTCNELLVDLTYCVHDEQIYCERHYAEQLKPRCGACDELIFSGEYTKAMSKDWHLGHFSCWQCDESLTGQRYVLRDDHPYCVKCYETVFANTCDDCGKLIGIDSKDLSYKDRHWHEACFLCSKCGVSLVDKQFGSKAEKIYCGGCYDSMFATRCDACGEIFRAGTKKMEYKSRQWHEKCFCCCVCKTAIGTKSFIPRDQDIYCTGCYEEKFATRCIKCNKIITSGGVTYKNEPWHRECFTCTHCDKSLAGQRFTSRDEKPYCAECFGELFAKRCTACTKPITGIGGTRFISFEDRHWHNDCFVCASCTASLVGKGFITDGADILCPECAKQRVL